jgi:hypothetical protein
VQRSKIPQTMQSLIFDKNGHFWPKNREKHPFSAENAEK